MYIPTNNRPWWLLIWLIAAPLMVLTGCQQAPPVVDGTTAEILSGLRYPGQTDYGPDLDIIIVREGTSIRMTNRTPRSYVGMHLWLNQQYVRLIEKVEIGANKSIPLPSLINRHRESFPIGSFFQPDKARPVISAELYDPAANIRYRLTVHPDKHTLDL